MSRRQDVAFAWAVSNWVRATSEQARVETGWKDTCGSAERLYAGSPERLPGGVRVPHNTMEAERFSAILAKLPQEDRRAWLEWYGLVPQSSREPDDRRKAVLRARAKLALAWMEAQR